MKKINVTHYGEDYATVTVNGEDFETSLGLGEAIAKALKAPAENDNTIKKIHVSNMSSPRGSYENTCKVPNQFMIVTPEGTYFQSYASTIAFIPNGGDKTVLDESKWDYSKTTGKYRNQFLGEDKKETLKKIKDGTYLLADLNG